MAIENSVGLANENAGTVYHGRTLRRLFDRTMMGWDVRTLGGSATSGIANGGVARSGEYSVTQRGAGANMSVDITSGGSLVGGTESATQGEYFVFNDATVNVVISAADATNARIDVIGIQVRDKEYSGATDDARLVVVTGTPSGAPAVPTLPADFLSLAHVAVAALAASIVNANITDKRTRLSALGGITVCTSTTRPTVNLWHGQFIYETDTKRTYRYDGTNWRIASLVVVTASVTSGNNTVASGTYADLPTTGSALDLVVPCIAGDRIRWTINGLWENQATFGNLDGYIAAAGNYVSGGNADGIAGASNYQADYLGFSAVIIYTTVAGDISASTVTVRPRARQVSGNKVLRAQAGNALQASLENLGAAA